jgi:hypothetical protein
MLIVNVYAGATSGLPYICLVEREPETAVSFGMSKEPRKSTLGETYAGRNLVEAARGSSGGWSSAPLTETL